AGELVHAGPAGDGDRHAGRGDGLQHRRVRAAIVRFHGQLLNVRKSHVRGAGSLRQRGVNTVVGRRDAAVYVVEREAVALRAAVDGNGAGDVVHAVAGRADGHRVQSLSGVDRVSRTGQRAIHADGVIRG